MNALAASLLFWITASGWWYGRGTASPMNDLVPGPWREDPSTSVKTDSLFNPFRLSFPFFGGEPSIVDEAVDDKVSTTDDKAGKTVSGRRRRVNSGTWFPFLTGPKTGSNNFDEGKSRQLSKGRKTDESSPGSIAGNFSTIGETAVVANSTSQLKFPFEKSFPQSGLGDFLIVFEKVAPKSKMDGFDPFNAPHICGEACQEGTCEVQNLDASGFPKSESNDASGIILNRFDRLFLIIIPVVLGIGTLFFILELRRIHRNMKKQAMMSTFGQTEC